MWKYNELICNKTDSEKLNENLLQNGVIKRMQKVVKRLKDGKKKRQKTKKITRKSDSDRNVNALGKMCLYCKEREREREREREVQKETHVSSSIKKRVHKNRLYEEKGNKYLGISF